MLNELNFYVMLAETEYILEVFLYSDILELFVSVGCFHQASFVFEHDLLVLYCVGQMSPTSWLILLINNITEQ